MWWVFGKQIWLLGGWLLDCWSRLGWTGSTSRGHPSIPPSTHQEEEEEDDDNDNEEEKEEDDNDNEEEKEEDDNDEEKFHIPGPSFQYNTIQSIHPALNTSSPHHRHSHWTILRDAQIHVYIFFYFDAFPKKPWRHFVKCASCRDVEGVVVRFQPTLKFFFFTCMSMLDRVLGQFGTRAIWHREQFRTMRRVHIQGVFLTGIPLKVLSTKKLI